MVRKGHNIRLKCEALGDKPIGITWTRDKQKIDAVTNVDTMGSSSPDNRYELNESITTKGIVSEVLIKKADRRDSSQFTCLASNAFGYDDTNIQLIVQEPPDPPQDVHLLEITSRSVKISWSPPYSGNSPIINYYIQYRTGIISSDLSKWSMALNVSIPSGETVGQIVGLRPSVLYFFRLISENHIGRSEASRSVIDNLLDLISFLFQIIFIFFLQ
jgi:Down syndrome cell adhesion protein